MTHYESAARHCSEPSLVDNELLSSQTPSSSTPHGLDKQSLLMNSPNTSPNKSSPRERRYLGRQQAQHSSVSLGGVGSSSGNPFSVAARTSNSNMHRYQNKPKTEVGLKRSFSLVPERMNGVSSHPFLVSTSLANCEYILQGITVLLIFFTLPFSLIVCLKVIAQYQRAVVFRLGRLLSKGALGPGLIFVLPCLDTVKRVDLRTFTFDVPTQEILTKDSVTVAVDAVVYYRIFDPVMSVVNVEDANRSTRLLAQTTLRNVLGTGDLSTLLTDQDNMAAVMQETLDLATDTWGVKVERVEIKHVRLPTQLQRAMAAEAEATREAKAKVIAAEGEQLASKGLKRAALEISCCPIALQLRYLQTLNSISAEKNSTIIFPLPIDVLSQYLCHDPRIHDDKLLDSSKSSMMAHKAGALTDSPVTFVNSRGNTTTSYPLPPPPSPPMSAPSYSKSFPLLKRDSCQVSLDEASEEARDVPSALSSAITTGKQRHGRCLRKMPVSYDCDHLPELLLSDDPDSTL